MRRGRRTDATDTVMQPVILGADAVVEPFTAERRSDFGRLGLENATGGCTNLRRHPGAGRGPMCAAPGRALVAMRMAFAGTTPWATMTRRKSQRRVFPDSRARDGEQVGQERDAVEFAESRTFTPTLIIPLLFRTPAFVSPQSDFVICNLIQIHDLRLIHAHGAGAKD